jgi:hypothetical protein
MRYGTQSVSDGTRWNGNALSLRAGHRTSRGHFTTLTKLLTEFLWMTQDGAGDK